MIKFIKTEGKTDQEIQDYIDECVVGGANAFECVAKSKTSITYLHKELKIGKYAGVHIDGDTFISDNIESFIDIENLGSFDIERLLNIEECAKKIAKINDYSLQYDDLISAISDIEEALK